MQIFRILILIILIVSIFNPINAECQKNKELDSWTTGILIPLYHSPKPDVYTDPYYNKILELKKKYPSVPVILVLNIDNGPGSYNEIPDFRFTQLIRRMHGSNIKVIGYVHTLQNREVLRGLGDLSIKPISEWGVLNDMYLWKNYYPEIDGLFFDEMLWDPQPANVNYYARLTYQAHDLGLCTVVGNPGTNQHPKYFEARAADIIVVHENKGYPNIEEMKSNFRGHHIDYSPLTRAALIHSEKEIDYTQLLELKKYVGYIYITHTVYVNKDTNVWEPLSNHLEKLFAFLATPIPFLEKQINEKK